MTIIFLLILLSNFIVYINMYSFAGYLLWLVLWTLLVIEDIYVYNAGYSGQWSVSGAYNRRRDQ